MEERALGILLQQLVHIICWSDHGETWQLKERPSAEPNTKALSIVPLSLDVPQRTHRTRALNDQ